MKYFGWLALFLIACTGCQRRSAATNDLRVGMELSYPPFEMTDTQGQPTGVGVDLARALADSLHRKLVIEDIPFDGLIPALKTGKIDLIISSMTATEERARSIDFSDPYVFTGISILAGKNSPVHSAADLNREDRTVAVKKATTGHLYAADHLPRAHVIILDQESACVLEVIQGKADAFIYDQISILQNWMKNPDATRALLEPIQKENWAIGIRKGNDSLRNDVNRFLADFKAKHGFDALSDRYLKEQKAAFQKLGYPFLFE